jgi:TFIIS helical bundle-like domain
VQSGTDERELAHANEAHGESWDAGYTGNGENLDEGLAELGLGGEGDDMEEYDPGEQGQDDQQVGYDDPNMYLEAEKEAPKPVSATLQKKQREHEEHLALLEQVKALCIKMEKALEDDAVDVMNGKPGLRKLTMLSEVCTLIYICADHTCSRQCCSCSTVYFVQIDSCASQVKAHPLLLQSGFLGLLKGFLEPLQTPRMNAEGDHLLALPHMQIRKLVYKLLGTLPISTHQQEGRNILKSSAIGPVLRFYAKVKHETEANRRAVAELLNRWMLPIIEEGRKAVRDDHSEAQRLKVRAAMPGAVACCLPFTEVAQSSAASVMCTHCGAWRRLHESGPWAALRLPDQACSTVRLQVVEAEMRRRRALDKQKDAKEEQRMKAQQEGRRVGDAGYRCAMADGSVCCAEPACHICNAWCHGHYHTCHSHCGGRSHHHHQAKVAHGALHGCSCAVQCRPPSAMHCIITASCHMRDVLPAEAPG